MEAKDLTEDEAREFYQELKVACKGNTELEHKCIRKFKEDDLLHHIVGMQGLATEENAYIDKIMKQDDVKM